MVDFGGSAVVIPLVFELRARARLPVAGGPHHRDARPAGRRQHAGRPIPVSSVWLDLHRPAFPRRRPGTNGRGWAVGLTAIVVLRRCWSAGWCSRAGSSPSRRSSASSSAPAGRSSRRRRASPATCTTSSRTTCRWSWCQAQTAPYRHRRHVPPRLQAEFEIDRRHRPCSAERDPRTARSAAQRRRAGRARARSPTFADLPELFRAAAARRRSRLPGTSTATRRSCRSRSGS